MASVQPKNVASVTLGGLALTAVYVMGQRAMRKHVEHRFDQEMEELVHRIIAIQYLRDHGGQAAKVADILDRLEQMGILIPTDNVDADEEAAEGITFVPNTGGLEFTFPERLSLLIRPRVNDRTSLKMLIALQQIMNELADACDMAGIELGIETNRQPRRRRK